VAETGNKGKEQSGLCVNMNPQQMSAGWHRRCKASMEMRTEADGSGAHGHVFLANLDVILNYNRQLNKNLAVFSSKPFYPFLESSGPTLQLLPVWILKNEIYMGCCISQAKCNA
jgi:hypothetical protein